MSGRHQQTGSGRCDCVACFGFRLAAGMMLTGLAALVLVAAVLDAGRDKPLLVETRQTQGSAR